MTTERRYLIYIIYFLLAIPVVILLFKFIEPKKLASLFAASLFISCSLIVLWSELKSKSVRSFSFWIALAFLIIFSVPMMVSRLIHYDLDFSEINFGPISGPDFHKYSNYGFMALIVAPIVDFLKSRKQRQMPTAAKKI